MTRSIPISIAALAMICCIATPRFVAAQETKPSSPTTRAAEAPQRPGAGAGGMRPGAMVERLLESLEKLELSDDQKSQARTLLEETRTRFQQIREESKGDMQAAREKMQPIFQETRQKLTAILSPEQREKLRDLMTQQQGNAPDATRRGARRDGASGSGGGATPSTKPSNANPSAATTAPSVDVGQPAPDFNLKKLDGQSLQLSSLKGKMVLVVFGSYSSPSFRQRAAGLEQLARQYGTRVHPLVIYTRENYPTGQWEVARNKDEGISVQQPATIEARIAQARQARDALKLSVPILIDSMDDHAATAYGGQTNAALLIGRDGTIVARQKWFEPYGMRRAIEEALKESPKSSDRAS